jgi:hypothetical protein
MIKKEKGEAYFKLARVPRETKDDGFKTVLGTRELFAQFIHDFIKGLIRLGILQNVAPEDIEFISISWPKSKK